MAIAAAQNMENNRGGSGRGYMPMRRPTPKKGKYQPHYSKDARMRFKNSRDPIFVAFDHIEKQSPLKLTKDLIKDSIEDSINTIGKTLVKLFN
mgnify:CR=1 FL=1